MLLTILIIIAFGLFFWHSEFNTKKTKYGHTHLAHNDGQAQETFQELHRRVEILKSHLYKKYGCKGCGVIEKFNMHARTMQLIENYNLQSVYEISPHNITGSTSFTEGKGAKIVMCIRDKSGKIHDINTLTFVMLHELTHVMNDRWGHEKQFWELFKIILDNAVECGIYKFVDYEQYPESYCGIKITQNPITLF